jgi:hypothetical protein
MDFLGEGLIRNKLKFAQKSHQSLAEFWVAVHVQVGTQLPDHRLLSFGCSAEHASVLRHTIQGSYHFLSLLKVWRVFGWNLGD